MQIWMIELQKWRNIHLEIGMLRLIKSKDVVNWGIYWHHVAVDLLLDCKIAHKSDFDISLFDNIAAGLDKVRMTYVSSRLKLKQYVNFCTWGKQDSVLVGNQVVVLTSLLPLLFPVLELVHLIYHLNFTEFGEFAVWVVNRDLVSLSLFAFVLYWYGQKVHIAWNYWYLD